MATNNNRSKSNKGASKKVTRVRWTPEEQTVLINQAAGLLVERQAFSLREAFNKSQDKLPLDRRRQIAALTQIPWFTEAVPKRTKEMEGSQSNDVQTKIDEAVRTARLEVKGEIKQQVIKQAAEIFTEVILVALQDPRIRGILSGGARQIDLGQVKVDKTKLKRVIVAGGLNGQAHVLEKEFGNKLDIRFWSKDQSNETLKSMLAHADAVVGMVGFLSHSHDNILKSSKVQYHPVSGGVTQVKNALNKLVD